MQSFQGQLEGLLLAILQQGPLHGYAIASELRARSDGALEVAEGTMYPVLHKLEKQGLVRSHWERSAAGADACTPRHPGARLRSGSGWRAGSA